MIGILMRRTGMAPMEGVLLWGIALTMLLPMSYIQVHNLYVRWRVRTAPARWKRKQRKYAELMDRKYPPRLDRFAPTYVEAVRAVVRTEFGGMPDFKRREDRIVETYCSVLVDGLRHLDEFVWGDLTAACRDPDKAMAVHVSMKLFAARRVYEGHPLDAPRRHAQ